MVIGRCFRVKERVARFLYLLGFDFLVGIKFYDIAVKVLQRE